MDLDLGKIVLETGDTLLLDSNLVGDYSALMNEDYVTKQHDPLANNEDFSIEAQDILDFTEINPFGEVIRNV
jgi:hypothetical protein